MSAREPIPAYESSHNPVANAREALVAALSKAEDSPADADARVEVVERAAQFAIALIESPGELPEPGAYTDTAQASAENVDQCAGEKAEEGDDRRGEAAACPSTEAGSGAR
eukprot:2261648-Prymnesium_polylepis.1